MREVPVSAMAVQSPASQSSRVSFSAQSQREPLLGSGRQRECCVQRAASGHAEAWPPLKSHGKELGVTGGRPMQRGSKALGIDSSASLRPKGHSAAGKSPRDGVEFLNSTYRSMRLRFMIEQKVLFPAPPLFSFSDLCGLAFRNATCAQDARHINLSGLSCSKVHPPPESPPAKGARKSTSNSASGEPMAPCTSPSWLWSACAKPILLAAQSSELFYSLTAFKCI